MKWQRNIKNLTKYELVENGEIVGTMKSDSLASSRAVCEFGKNRFSIELESIWKNKKIVKDANGNIIAKTYPKNWYGATEILEIEGKELKMKFRNNPLAEYIIFEDETKPLVTCGIYSGKNYMVKTDFAISNEAKTLLFSDILSALVWYSFKNIVAENVADDGTIPLIMATTS